MGLEDVHKYSQVGQARGSQSRQEEVREGRDGGRDGAKEAKEGSERREPKEGGDRSQAKEGWDKGNSAMKSEPRDWRESKAVFGGGFQTQNNSGLNSRVRHQPQRKLAWGTTQSHRLQPALRRVN